MHDPPSLGAVMLPLILPIGCRYGAALGAINGYAIRLTPLILKDNPWSVTRHCAL